MLAPSMVGWFVGNYIDELVVDLVCFGAVAVAHFSRFVVQQHAADTADSDKNDKTVNKARVTTPKMLLADVAVPAATSMIVFVAVDLCCCCHGYRCWLLSHSAAHRCHHHRCCSCRRTFAAAITIALLADSQSNAVPAAFVALPLQEHFLLCH